MPVLLSPGRVCSNSDSAMIVGELLVVAIRILASHFRWDLPTV